MGTDNDQSGAKVANDSTGTTTSDDATQPTAAEQAKAKKEQAAQAKAARDAEPRFSRDRVLGPGGEQIIGVDRHILVGALVDSDARDYTRSELEELVAAFLDREVTTED